MQVNIATGLVRWYRPKISRNKTPPFSLNLWNNYSVSDVRSLDITSSPSMLISGRNLQQFMKPFNRKFQEEVKTRLKVTGGSNPCFYTKKAKLS